jgi:mono/diheme cytochrome c family protein
MRKSLKIGFVFFVFVSSHEALAQDKALIDAGERVYATNCATCHGENLVNPGTTFDLKKLGANERARFNESVTDGKGQMPAWGGILSDEQFDQLWAYIRANAYN